MFDSPRAVSGCRWGRAVAFTIDVREKVDGESGTFLQA
jgi:hypothetical protein